MLLPRSELFYVPAVKPICSAFHNKGWEDGCGDGMSNITRQQNDRDSQTCASDRSRSNCCRCGGQIYKATCSEWKRLSLLHFSSRFQRHLHLAHHHITHLQHPRQYAFHRLRDRHHGCYHCCGQCRPKPSQSARDARSMQQSSLSD